MTHAPNHTGLFPLTINYYIHMYMLMYEAVKDCSFLDTFQFDLFFSVYSFLHTSYASIGANMFLKLLYVSVFIG